MVSILCAILILSCLSALVYISFQFIELANDNEHKGPKNFALELAIVCYDLVILVIAIKYLTNSVKVNLNI